MIPPVPHVAALQAYTLADLTPPKSKTLISLSQNESLRPPSPQCAQAVVDAFSNAALYPDPDWTALRGALCALHHISTDGILCGNGSMDLIACIARAYADANSAILAPAHAYPFFRNVAHMVQARFDAAPEDGTTVSVNALLQAVRPDTRVVFVANPGNPTGTRIPKSELIRLRSELPADKLLVIDEAYGEFADHFGESCFNMVDAGNTVVLRTLSKAYGLAGVRVGWGLFPPDIAAQIRKVMNPNNVSTAGQAAAVAALKDQAYMKETCTITAALRDGFANNLRTAGYEIGQSHTNFVLIPFANAAAARLADQVLRSEGIFLRAQTGAGLGHALRATIGASSALDLTTSLLAPLKSKGK